MYRHAPYPLYRVVTMRRLLPLLPIALLLTACGTTGNTPEPTLEPETRTEVPWDDYTPGLQATIDNATCDELDEQFNNAVANNDPVAETTDHNNSDLMEYIDEAGALAGC